MPIRTGDDPGDDARIRGRMQRTIERYAGGICESLDKLAQLGLVDKARAQVRVHSSAPLFKLYLINEEEFFGFYPEALGSQYVTDASQWFESIWSTIVMPTAL